MDLELYCHYFRETGLEVPCDYLGALPTRDGRICVDYLTHALPDGLCRPCRETHSASRGEENTPHPADIADVKAHMNNLRDLLKPV